MEYIFFFFVGKVAILTHRTILHKTVKCHRLLLQHFFKISFVGIKDTAEIVRLKYLLDRIDSGLTSSENLSYCLGKKGGRMPMNFL